LINNTTLAQRVNHLNQQIMINLFELNQIIQNDLFYKNQCTSNSP